LKIYDKVVQHAKGPFGPPFVNELKLLFGLLCLELVVFQILRISDKKERMYGKVDNMPLASNSVLLCIIFDVVVMSKHCLGNLVYFFLIFLLI
jgi:hypothetical protein